MAGALAFFPIPADFSFSSCSLRNCAVFCSLRAISSRSFRLLQATAGDLVVFYQMRMCWQCGTTGAEQFSRYDHFSFGERT